LPTRQAASGAQGTLTRDRLALRLQECDLDFRQARKAVDAILDSMIERLRRGDKVNVPPLGRFWIKAQPATRQRLRLGRLQRLFRQPTRVAFQPTKELKMLLKQRGRWFEGKSEMTKHNPQQFCCEKCGSTMFTEGHFRQWRQLPSSLPGSDLVAITEGLAIRALICVCGQPVRLGRLRRQVPGDQKGFEKSFEKAVRFRQAADPQAIVDKLSGSFASQAQQSALADQISLMEQVVAKLPKPNKQ
jgi:nucleoid DNA-binding protein